MLSSFREEAEELGRGAKLLWLTSGIGVGNFSWKLGGLGIFVGYLGSSRESCGCEEGSGKFGLYVHDQEVVEFVVAPIFCIVGGVRGKGVGSLNWEIDGALAGPKQAGMNLGCEV